MNPDRLYFDYNATAPLTPGLDVFLSELLQQDLKNPSSVHQDGQRARAVIERARRQIKTLLGAQDKDDLVFTSGGSESNNTVLVSAYQRRQNKNKILVTGIEHSCVLETAAFLQKQGALVETLLVSRDGELDWQDYEQKLTSDCFLVSAMLVNNETGFVLPVQKMAKLARERGVPFHTDAVCAIGKVPVHFTDLGVDYLTFSSHKFGGLKGAGGLLYKKGVMLDALIHGGPQELGKRAGTENILGIASSAFALQKVLADRDEESQRQRVLREKLKAGLQEIDPDVLFTESREQASQTLNAAFLGLNGNLLVTNLDLEGVSASFGSACASGSLELSHVLLNLGLKLDEARSALRFSFGALTTEDHVQDLRQRLQRVITRMRS